MYIHKIIDQDEPAHSMLADLDRNIWLLAKFLYAQGPGYFIIKSVFKKMDSVTDK